MDPEVRPRPAFAHASEAEMARILDFYDVRWVYEPHLFPILWNLDGDVLESFAPDFWLPDLDLYLEMTTLKQRLVRKKNRKLRRLRELYPDIRIKLFYARDFRMLMLKYGRLALVDDMSGSSGQVISAAASSIAAVAAAVDDAVSKAPMAADVDVPGTLLPTSPLAERRPTRRERRRAREAAGVSSDHPALAGVDPLPAEGDR
jgi:hypothetical protein